MIGRNFSFSLIDITKPFNNSFVTWEFADDDEKGEEVEEEKEDASILSPSSYEVWNFNCKQCVLCVRVCYYRLWSKSRLSERDKRPDTNTQKVYLKHSTE